MATQEVKFPEHHHHNEENKDQKKKTGKRKIEYKPITNKTSQQVTFSKRRKGLFKKAAELCFLCGAEVAVITFSRAGKVFSFGHPFADDVINRYINFSAHNNKCADFLNNGNGNNMFSNFDKLSEEYKNVFSNIEKRRTEVTSLLSNGSSPCGNVINNDNNTNTNNNNNNGFWWDNVIVDDLDIVELERLKVALEGVRAEVSSKIDPIHRCSSMSNLYHPKIESGSSNYGNGFAQGYGDYGMINNDDQVGASESFHPSLLLPCLPMDSLFGQHSENFGNF